MSEISDEMRDWCDRNDENGCGGFVTEYSFEELCDLADRADRELVELPRDRDGVPVHLNDTVYDSRGEECHVNFMTLYSNGDATVRVGDGVCSTAMMPSALTHERPDSFERIAHELEAWCDDVDVDGDACGKPRDLVERIRKLAAKEDER